MESSVLSSDKLKVLGLNENATLEDIQISFAYLYQMIDLIYPSERDNYTEKQRENELKKLETAYFLALKVIKEEVFANCNYVDNKIDNPTNELNRIEAFISNSDYYSYKFNNLNIINDKNEDAHKNNFIAKRWENENIKPWLNILGKGYLIKYLSEKEITITPSISEINVDTVKGELHFPDISNIRIVGKVIENKNNQTKIRLVTRIARKIVHQYDSNKDYW